MSRSIRSTIQHPNFAQIPFKLVLDFANLCRDFRQAKVMYANSIRAMGFSLESFAEVMRLLSYRVMPFGEVLVPGDGVFLLRKKEHFPGQEGEQRGWP
jgi:hypothetical protein